MEELVDGQRLIYVISEFWKALDHEIFSDFAKQKQKTIRKHNGLGIFDTQSPSDVLRHAIGRTMVEQSVTKIFLANPEAVRSEYVDGFGLSEAEYDIVRSLGAQGGRRFLVKQGHASAICELDLSGLDDFVTVLSATTDNVALLDGIRARHGDDPCQWLPVLLREVQDRSIRTSGRRHDPPTHLLACAALLACLGAGAPAAHAQFVPGNEAVQRGQTGGCRSRLPPLPAKAGAARPSPAASRTTATPGPG
jgi:type IV secretion system protein VirB4